MKTMRIPGPAPSLPKPLCGFGDVLETGVFRGEFMTSWKSNQLQSMVTRFHDFVNGLNRITPGASACLV